MADVLRELVDKALRREGDRPSAEDDESVVTRQQDAWEKLHAELMALPVSQEAKGFCGADHDEVLYGWKK